MTTRQVTKQKPHAPGRHQRTGQRSTFKDNPNFGIPWGQATWPRGGGGANPPPAAGHLGYYVYAAVPDADGEADHQGTLEQIRAADTDNAANDLLAALVVVKPGDRLYLRSETAQYGITVTATAYADPIFTFDGVDPPLVETGLFADDDIVSVGYVPVAVPQAPGHVGFWQYSAVPDAAGEVDHQGTLEQVMVHATDSDATDNDAIFAQVEALDEVYIYGPFGTYGITVDAAADALSVYTFDGNVTVIEETGTLAAGETVSVGVVLV